MRDIEYLRLCTLQGIDKYLSDNNDVGYSVFLSSTGRLSLERYKSVSAKLGYKLIKIRGY